MRSAEIDENAGIGEKSLGTRPGHLKDKYTKYVYQTPGKVLGPRRYE
jgi:hypothetical protein